MKKLLVVLLALATIGSMAFAEVSIGTWSRIGLSVYDQTGSAAAVTKHYPSWGNAGLSFSAKGDNAGMAADASFAPGSDNVTIGTNAKLWAKLFDMLTITAGKTQNTVLWGKIGGGSAIGTVKGGGNDDIFNSITIKNGLMAELAPVENLYLVGAIAEATSATTADAFKAVMADVGYTLPDVGLIRAGYLTDQVQAAFAFTGVKDLTVDVGGKYNLATSVIKASAAAKMTAGDLGFMGRTLITAGGSAAFDMGLGGYVNYKIDAVVVGADIGLNSISTAKVLNLTPYVQYNIPGGGMIITGVQTAVGLDGQPFQFGIPVVLQF
jgi:hypothetical protein